MGSLKQAVNTIRDTFFQYAAESGKKDTLNLDELKKIFNKEFPTVPGIDFNELATIIISDDKSKDIDELEFLVLSYCFITSTTPKKGFRK